MKPDFKRRRNTLREKTRDGVIILHKGGEHFNENLFYLTGLDTFYTTAIISLEDDFECILTNEIERPFLSKETGVEDIRVSNPDALDKQLIGILKEIHPKTIYTDYFVSSKTPLPAELIDSIKGALPKIRIKQLPQQLDQMRLMKDDYELNVMKRGVKVIYEIFKSIEGLIVPGNSEALISSEIYRSLVVEGFNKFYDISVASGERSTIPFYRENCHNLPKKGVVLIDIAAAIDYYVCDMTRTFQIGQVLDNDQASVFQLVEEVHAAIMERAVKDTTLAALNKIAADMFKAHGLDEFYYNKIGHFVGLGVSDPGDEHTLLEKGMVFTIEPGLYMQHRGFAVRKEDMVFL